MYKKWSILVVHYVTMVTLTY